MPLTPKIDPPEVSRAGPLTDTGGWTLTWQKWFTQAYRAILYLLAGIPQVTQANLAKFAASLDKQDTGIQVAVPDYNHVLQWTGTAWTFAPGDSGSNYTVNAGYIPAPTGWHLCDGTVQVPFLKADGTFGKADLPTTPGLWFRQ